MLTLVRTGEVLAADPAPVDPAAAKPEPTDLRQHAPLPTSLFAAPDSYSLAGMSEPKTFSTTDFRPRGHSILDSDLHLNLDDDALMHDTNVWQQFVRLSRAWPNPRAHLVPVTRQRTLPASRKERRTVASVDQPAVELAPELARSARPPVPSVRHRREQQLTRRPAPRGHFICGEGSGCNRPPALRPPDSALTDRSGASCRGQHPCLRQRLDSESNP